MNTRITAFMALVVVTVATEVVPGNAVEAPTATWSRTGNLTIGRYDHTATLLPNGKVLVTSRQSTPSSPPVETRTADGKVVVSGGRDGSALVESELYDLARTGWSRTADLNIGRSAHTATLLTDGWVLAASGRGSGGSILIYLELYGPKSLPSPSDMDDEQGAPPDHLAPALTPLP